MKKIVGFMISLSLFGAVSTSMLGIAATEINKIVVDAGASPIQIDLEETGKEIKESININKDGQVNVGEDFYIVLEKTFNEMFENPVNELMSNFGI